MTSCQLCNSTKTPNEFYPEHNIVRCTECGLVYYNNNVQVAELYNGDYYSGGEYLDYIGDRKIIQSNFKKRIRELRKLKPSGRLLEIGSAYGFFLDLARKHWEVKGFEISQDAASHARSSLGLDVQAVDFLSVADQPDNFDLICIWDTIEHLDKPFDFIDKASRWLKPGGYLVISTGDIESIVSRLKGSRWRLIHPPTHLFYFSPKTLRMAVKRAGLTVRSVKHIGYSRSYKNMMHGSFMLNSRKMSALYNITTFWGRLDFPVYLNLYDIMMLAAQKPESR